MSALYSSGDIPSGISKGFPSIIILLETGSPDCVALLNSDPVRPVPILPTAVLPGFLTMAFCKPVALGARYSAEAWKVVFASSIVKETNWIPDLHGGMLPLNPATSKFNVEQFTLLTELIISQAAKWGIDIQDITDA